MPGRPVPVPLVTTWCMLLTALHATAGDEYLVRRVPGWVGAVAFDPTGGTIAAGSSDNVVRLWDVASGRQTARLDGHEDYVASLDFSPDGKQLVTGGYDHTARIWSRDGSRPPAVLRGHRGVVMAARFSPDGRIVATGSVDGTVRLWNASTAGPIATLEGHLSWVNALAFSPDGKRLVSGSSDGTIRIWRVADREVERTITASKAEVRSVAWSRDGQFVAAGLRYGRLRVWSASDWSDRLDTQAHRADVWSVAFAPDSRTLLTGDGDWRQPGEVKLWGVARGDPLRTLPASEEVLSAAFSPDGKRIAAGATDGTVCVWNLNQKSERTMDPQPIVEAVTFYASFDEEVRGDHGGNLEVSTRHDHPETKGEFVVEKGYEKSAFRVAPKKGIVGGALECLDVLPRRGRMFFPARGNVAFDAKGWSGSASFWLNGNPDTRLKTSFCDPIQFTHRGAHDGGLWVDFPDTKPRDLRLGAYTALGPGETAVPESDPDSPTARLAHVGFEDGDWHHVVLTWENLDTGKPDARLVMYVDGAPVAELSQRAIAMKWDLDRTGLYFAVGYIGLFDEFAIFDRALSRDEVATLFRHPALVHDARRQVSRSARESKK